MLLISITSFDVTAMVLIVSIILAALIYYYGHNLSIAIKEWRNSRDYKAAMGEITEDVLQIQDKVIAATRIDSKLKKVAKISTEKIMNLSIHDAEKIIDKYEVSGSIEDHQILNIFLLLEIVIFYMHVADRLAFSKIGIKHRSVFMDYVLHETWGILLGYLVGTFGDTYAKADFMEMCNERQLEYGNYQEIYAGDNNYKGTLIWEFGKKISKLLCGSELDIRLIMPVYVLAVNSMRALEGVFEV